MEKYRVKAKFHNRKIVCISQIFCSDCCEINECEDIDIFIEEKFEGTKDCMTHNSYEKRNGKIKQKRWEK